MNNMPDTHKRILHDNNKRYTGPLNVIFDELDLTWTDEEMETAIKMYNMGFNIIDMARILRPLLGEHDGQWETYLLISYLIYKGLVNKRRGGILGNVC